MAELLIYGANGYTGERVAREALARGQSPILAGRTARNVHKLAASLDLRSRSFDLADPDRIDDHLSDVEAVLNCAGPFEDTAEPLVDACLRTGTNYLDITGEISVFERLARRSEDAEAAEITLLPGVGFDVVPTDCLAAHLHDRVPSASHLSVAIAGGGSISPGTAKTAFGGLGDGGAIRQDGTLRVVPAADRTRAVDFGWGERSVTAVPWGDVSTAYHTTGIPNVRVYMRLPTAARLAVRFGDRLGPLVGTSAVQSIGAAVIDRLVEGPDEADRKATRMTIWGEAWSRTTGETVESLLSTPDPYDVTVDAALAIADRVLEGEAPTGYRTPAGAFGPDLALELDGVSRTDR
ncbi:MAG: saccharopine dehydrogenase family protein [Halobacteriota archaeon]